VSEWGLGTTWEQIRLVKGAASGKCAAYFIEGPRMISARKVSAGMAFVDLDDKPEEAKWLTADEKVLIRHNLEHGSAAGHGHNLHSFCAALKEPKAYVLCAYMINFWLVTLIKEVSVSNTLYAGCWPRSLIASSPLAQLRSRFIQSTRWSAAGIASFPPSWRRLP
jgi:hypothetical protein